MSRARDLALFLVLAAVWGSAFMAITAGLAYFPPVLFAALRYDVAGVVMLAYAAYAVDDPIPRGRDEWTVVAIGATLIIAAYHALLFVGQTDPAVTSATASVIVSLSPVLTTVFARAFLPSERLTLVGVLGLLVGLVGAVVLAAPDPANLTGGGTVAKFLVLLAAASFALGSVLTRASDADVAIETMEAWSMLLGALLMHLVSAGLGESVADVAWTTEGIAALAYLSIAASGFGFLVYFDLLERLGPIEINLVSYVAPIFAAVAGWLFLSEGITPNTVAGFLIICAGFALVKRAALRAELRKYEISG
ncbi:DMT family transporter [Halorubrum sp. AD140]|uniref:DMT family transporter n=1 Tax=Halorubrum sp. AD140 TaxID=3050073 RepID=UPI002ACC5324|nr:DMT family transporter [Halorubrum sp. AD140]MDZ5809838.1 DMT family transporter [Halorubrum sp. AD140]